MPGKARDYTPRILAAGVDLVKDGTVANCLQNHSFDDAIETVMHEGGLKRVEPELKRQRMSNWRHRGIFQESRPSLTRPTPTRYQTLINDLKETALDSYWHTEIGRCRDPVGGFPAKMDVAGTTFGKKSASDTPMKLLISPEKSRFEILYETNEFHPMYRKTHNDYYPGEQIGRNYLEPPFIPGKKYGKRYNYDKSGPCSKILFRDRIGESVLSANKIQADFKQRSQFQVGKCLTPNNNINCMPPHASFGKKSNRPLCGVEELMKPDQAPNSRKKQFYVWLSHLNELRQYFKKHCVDFEDIENLCLFYDKEHTGWIKIDVFLQILVHVNVFFNRTLIFPLAEEFGYVEDNNVKYVEFLNMFQSNYELPDIPNLDADFDAQRHYITSSQMASCMDRLLCDNSQSPKAGAPSIKCDLKRTTDALESTASIAINPSVYTNYSLSHVDFWEPRSPKYIKSLFEAVGYEFPGDKFEKLWDFGQKIDCSREVCVDTFNQILQGTFRDKNKCT